MLQADRSDLAAERNVKMSHMMERLKSHGNEVFSETIDKIQLEMGL